MELIEGPTLADRIAESKSAGAIPLNEALPIARQIANALEAAHEKGIIHRDLKPGNIKIKPDGSVKVLDFGLAKRLSETSPLTSDSPTDSATHIGTILGTAAYMAPEQARGKAVDKRADIWAFGVVLCEMLTGRRLFQGEDMAETLASVVKEQPDLSVAPPQVRRLLGKCLEKDPRKRLRDFSAVELLLEDAEALSAPGLAASRKWWIWPTAGVLIAVLAWLPSAWIPWRGPKPSDRPLQRLNVDFGTDVDLRAPGAGSRIAISPDGGRLVYMSRGRLFSRRLDQPNSTELKGAEGANTPFFSPNGKWVGFVANGKLMKIPAQGGSPTVICDAYLTGGSWGDDDTIVASLADGSGLMRAPASGGTPVRITKLEADEVVHAWPQMLPGAKAALFTSNTSPNDGFNDAKIVAVRLKDGQRRTIQQGGSYGRYIPAASGLGHLIYVHDGVLFAVAFDPDALEERGVPVVVEENIASGSGGAAQMDFTRDGSLLYRPGAPQNVRTQLKWLNVAGSQANAQPLALQPDAYQFVRLSPDGQKIGLALRQHGATDLVVYDGRRDVTTRLTSGGKTSYPFVWSPDGRFIVFSGDGGLLWTRADGDGKPQLLHASTEDELPWSFAPDGKTISLTENGMHFGPGSDISTLPVESDATGLHGGKPEPFLQTRFSEGRSAFSPDGQWLAYSSDEGGGKGYGIYVRHFPVEGGTWPVANAGSFPRWSPAGHELFFLGRDNKTIWGASYTASGDTFIADKPTIRVPTQDNLIVSFDIAADGKRALVLQTSPVAGELAPPGHMIFLINFADELARRAPPAR